MATFTLQNKNVAVAGYSHGTPEFWLFCYGTLMVDTVFRNVTGLASQNAEIVTLEGYERRALSGLVYPGIRKTESCVHGRLYRVPKQILPALDIYEGDMYYREAITVSAGGGRFQAWCYVLRPRYCHLMLKTDWSVETFREKHLRHYLAQLGDNPRAPRKIKKAGFTPAQGVPRNFRT